MAALLRACALQAADLPDADTWPKDVRPDAFVKIAASDGATCQSPTVDNSRAPRWDFCCEIGVPGASSDLIFTIFDEDLVLESEAIGYAHARVPGEEGTRWLSLVSSDGDYRPVGQLEVSIELLWPPRPPPAPPPPAPSPPPPGPAPPRPSPPPPAPSPPPPARSPPPPLPDPPPSLGGGRRRRRRRRDHRRRRNRPRRWCRSTRRR